MPDPETPQFQHDSECCTFLGRLPAAPGTKLEFDLYHCNGGGRPTVIARYSDDGPAYISGMLFADRELIPELVEAKKRAVERGLPTTREELLQQEESAACPSPSPKTP